ncbi:S26 family signal peptidase [Tuwongella immobilis]|uniref:Signal peptidase I n=1 Tax=Tuwongella immobilis TaxID=692036 RepID=A0A6C2YM61_9BACT|nr:S26 family signal peptidase [Tuwongella immobilis]VIP02401.1 signal peptidase i : Signal peptidase I OS=Singulisphaera acidiphila (strain ATCC BAA-1392 / DSM 18658 / VKM B-2454 / MOB10) GN=Sinac_1881 PE=3 SV=1: Peptidase_S24 [Tuwongella immobilis]VTS01289.1 signal peptidase i : Signal peptidase I OS=Singulisphaera acidiphila (strain ATCC BAA-1392 / DSM 18658 / VKM B-2454 / MOB10) GN=Sinac_1881 PE=3 SV=1: Peptidase_S24 [Tuwongella immobilis]
MALQPDPPTPPESTPAAPSDANSALPISEVYLHGLPQSPSLDSPVPVSPPISDPPSAPVTPIQSDNLSGVEASAAITPAPSPTSDSEEPLSTGSQLRRLIESILVCFLMLLFLRTILVEPSGVPTGSMAPTLLGNHFEWDCPDCHMRHAVGVTTLSTDAEDLQALFADHQCPHCGASLQDVTAASVKGDRVLVNKSVYQFRDPKRWEAAVFRPRDDARSFVKRVIGLPGESVQLIDGDAWINGAIARKSLKQLRETAILLHDSRQAPADGWEPWWVVEADHADATPHAALDRKWGLLLDARGKATQEVSATWRNWNPQFQFEQPLRDQLVYNWLSVSPRSSVGKSSVHDFLVTLDVTVIGGSGAFEVALFDGVDWVRVSVPLGTLEGELRVDRNESVPLHREPMAGWQPNERHSLTLAFADRRVMLELDEREAILPIDLPPARERPPVSRPLQLRVERGAVMIPNLRLERDLHLLARGTHAGTTALELDSESYFMLGDNAANSDDSRFWKNPGVPRTNFLGKPFLLHQPSRGAKPGLTTAGQFESTFDWSRVRWLR